MFESSLVEHKSLENNIGTLYLFDCGNVLYKELWLHRKKLFIEEPHQHSFEEHYISSSLHPFKALVIYENQEKLRTHDLLPNEIFHMRKNNPHQLIVANVETQSRPLRMIMETKKESEEKNTIPLDHNLVRIAMEKGMLSDIGWLAENKRFMETLSSL
jgi:hypothetical protein